MKIKLLSSQDIKKAVNMSLAIESVKEAFVQLSRGEAEVPLRTQVPVTEAGGISLFMPAYLKASHSLGAKIVSVFPKNSEKSLPTIHALVIVIDARTGRTEAVMDGTYLTALRTGAAAGLATDLLSKTDSAVAAVFGAGTQGRTQLEAVCVVRAITKVWIFDPNEKSALAFADEIKRRGKPFPSDISLASDPAQAVREADVICTATTSHRPVFADDDLPPGVHINAIGSYTPAMQEIPAATIARSKIVVDSLPAVLEEAGDIIIPLKEEMISMSDIHGEIGQVASGLISARESDTEITFFKSVGNAVQDVAVSKLILSRAEQMNLGLDVDI
ncbi:MAG: hypothetical protein JXB23_04510 [Candidatus Aminicenantes bacterium]|nr:hypothetical protein [Candidatus Aminicenantes bacterium]